MSHIADFLRNHYPDDRLIELLTMVREGTLEFESCDCFVGFATHVPGVLCAWEDGKREHYWGALKIPGAKEAETEYYNLAQTDPVRCEKLLLFVEFEVNRRMESKEGLLILKESLTLLNT